jgi:signal transduction histidine kinase
MLSTIFGPWRTTRTWRRLVFVLLDLIVGAVTFTVVFSLLVTSVSLLIVFPIALPFAWLLFVSARGLGIVERSRLRSLLEVDLPDPHPPLPPGSWWAHLKARVSTASRWREIGYHLLRLPVGAVTTTVALATWSGAAAMLAMPLVVSRLPGDTARLGLFEIHQGAEAWWAGAIGLVGVVLIAPWATIGLARLDGLFARGLLASHRPDELAQRVVQLEASRAAAVDSAEAERRRIERDLHDGAQQRMVALAMDLGLARERFDEDPVAARALVVDAHEEAKAALSDLRDLVRGIHPAILEDRGLDAALSSVVARASVAVSLSVDVADRPSPAIEATAYFVVSEALTNVDKHANATKATVTIVGRGDRLVVEVSDDGSGGADAAQGTGLRGLEDRVRSVGGWMHVMSPAGGPTTVLVELPCAS